MSLIKLQKEEKGTFIGCPEPILGEILNIVRRSPLNWKEAPLGKRSKDNYTFQSHSKPECMQDIKGA